MNENHSPEQFSAQPPQMDFHSRAPSQTWEAVPIPNVPGHFIWCWFKPMHAPQGIIFQIPPEAVEGYPDLARMSIRDLVQVAGIPPDQITGWFHNGTSYDSENGSSPLLDQPVPLPKQGEDPNLLVYLKIPKGGIPVPGGLPNEQMNVEESFRKMELDWKESLTIVRRLSMKRKELNDMVTKLRSLNRDLNTDEVRFSTQQDQGEWRDARRFLRDIATKLDMYIKQHDIGVTSFAGKREWFEKLYHQHVKPRIVFDNMFFIEREFEQYRKTHQTLMSQMNTSQIQAARDGERRAQQVLAKIRAKVQAGRSKRFDAKNPNRSL